MAYPRRRRKRRLRAVILFSGIGGGTAGLKRAGYDIVLAVDSDESDICNINHKRLTDVTVIKANLLYCNLRRLCRQKGINPDIVDLVLLSPPCAGVSRAGAKDPADIRNRLIEQVPARAAIAFPNAFLVVENVLSLVRSRKMRRVLEAMRRNLRRAGRRVPTRREILEKYILNAADYGIAQSRIRVFIPIPPSRHAPWPVWSAPTHVDKSKRKNRTSGLLPWVGLGEALKDMGEDPHPFSPLLRDAELATYGARNSIWTRRYAKKLADRAWRKRGVRGYRPLKGTDPARPLPCLTKRMKIPSRVVGLHPSELRLLTIGELIKAAFGFLCNVPMLDGSSQDLWDALADAIVPRCAELVGKAIRDAIEGKVRSFTKASTRPVLLYAGSKRNIVDSIISLLGPIGLRAYYEPFAGSGAVLLEVARRNPHAHLNINDADPNVAAFWWVIAHGSKAQREKLAKLLQRRPTRNLFARLKGMQPRSMVERAYKAVLIGRATYNNYLDGGFNQASADRYPSGLEQRFWEHVNLLADRTTVTCRHFREVLKEAPLDAVIYLDPPYHEQGRYYYARSMTELEHEELACSLQDRENWLLSYADEPVVRKRYDSSRIVNVPTGFARGNDVLITPRSRPICIRVVRRRRKVSIAR